MLVMNEPVSKYFIQYRTWWWKSRNRL